MDPGRIGRPYPGEQVHPGPRRDQRRHRHRTVLLPGDRCHQQGVAEEVFAICMPGGRDNLSTRAGAECAGMRTQVDQVGSHGTMAYPLAGLVQIGGDPRQPIGSPRGQAEGDDLGLQIDPVGLDHGTIPPQGRYRVRQV